MIKTKIKKLAKKIIISLFLALFLSTTASILIQNPTNVAYAADPAPCKPEKETAETCTKANKEAKCPQGYTKTSDTLCKKEASTPTDTDDIKKTISFLIQIQGVLNSLIWPVLVMTGGLLDNSILFGNGMEERLREIWIPIRNIVNILFVIALVAIALYNVLGIGEEGSSYSIKAMLPKIIVGIIAVNFSFLGIKLFLDTINVLTVSIFALPNQMGQSTVLDPTIKKDQEIIDLFCRASEGKKLNEVIDANQFETTKINEIYVSVANSSKYDLKVPMTATKEDVLKALDVKTNNDAYEKQTFLAEVERSIQGMLCTGGKEEGEEKKGFELTDNGKLFLRRWNSRNAALALALNLSKIVFYEKIDAKSVATVEKLFVNAVLSLLLYLVFLASFIALFVVLLGRLVVMWLAIALSPVLLLGLAVPELKDKMGFGELITQFVGNAIAPLTIALSLTVGWIMLNALQSVNGLYNGGSISFSAGNGLPVVGLTTMQDLLVGVGTIGVIWLGVFTAASKSIAAPVTNMLKGALQSAGSYIGTMPLKHAPLFHVDLPGAEDDADHTYTGLQLQRGFNAITNPPNPDKMANLLRPGDKTASVDTLLEQKDAKGVYSWINTGDRAPKLKRLETETIEAFRRLKEQNGKAWQDLMTKPGMDAQFRILLDPSAKEADKVKAATEIARVAKASGAAGLTPGKADAAKQKPLTTKTEDKPKEDKPIEKGKTKVYGDAALTTEEQVIAYTAQRSLLVEQITKGAPKADLEARLTRLNSVGGEGTPKLTPANLKAVLSEADYKALVDEFGDESKLTEFLTKLPAKTPAAGGDAGAAGGAAGVSPAP